VLAPERNRSHSAGSLDQEIRAARADLAKLERQYGAAAANNAEQRRPTMRGFKTAQGKFGKQLRAARARVARLFERRRNVLKRVEVRDLSERAVVKLATERKHLTDIIKMIAYQAESDLLALLRPHYARADQEGRTLLHEIFTTAGDIRVSHGELQITTSSGRLSCRSHRRLWPNNVANRLGALTPRLLPLVVSVAEY
jgi:inorganic triphosphatase YgiF